MPHLQAVHMDRDRVGVIGVIRLSHQDGGYLDAYSLAREVWMPDHRQEVLLVVRLPNDLHFRLTVAEVDVGGPYLVTTHAGAAGPRRCSTEQLSKMPTERPGS